MSTTFLSGAFDTLPSALKGQTSFTLEGWRRAQTLESEAIATLGKGGALPLAQVTLLEPKWQARVEVPTRTPRT